MALAAAWSKVKDPKGILPGLEPAYNIAPTDPAVVIVQRDNEPEFDRMTFGLIPHWAKDPKIAFNCLNARAESVDEKPAFRESFKQRRCLVPIDGFYEWKHEGKAKIPHRITLKNRKPFALAGVWDTWKGLNGKQITSFSIITTEANSLLTFFHDRMPVVVEAANENLWLAPYVTESKTLVPLLKPFPAEEMDMYQVSSYVSKSTNKGEECIQPVP